jgi:NIPSNAP
MTWQLRLYAVREGEWDAWVAEWREQILPLRLAAGFEVLGPWRTEDGRFAWLIGHEDFAAADAAYYASPERAAIQPDPARHLTEIETTLLEGA